MQKRHQNCVRLRHESDGLAAAIAAMRNVILLTVLLSASMMPACADGNDLPCEERSAHASAMVQDALRDNRSCMTNDDCTSVSPEIQCAGGCGDEPVAKAGLKNVQEAVRQANHDYCEDFSQDGCSYATPGCIATNAMPTCSSKGQCVMTSP